MINESVQFASGYALRIAVERGQLVVEDGVGAERRTRRFSRINRNLKRLVVLGHSGTVTLDALRWLTDIGAAFVHIDNDGTLITVGVPGQLNDVRVRRGQAYAAGNGVGLYIVRELLRDKIRGQRRVARQLDPAPNLVQVMKDAEGALGEASTIPDLRLIEARAASAYWQTWQGLEVHFPKSERKRVPEHWRAFDTRTSALSVIGARKATNPINALLNYLYAILEAESRISLRLVGADPDMGLLHADKPGRESFALDVLEPARPDVDAYVLRLVRDHTFRRSDFFETRQGVCRLMPSVARPMARTSPRWAKAVAPHAERVAGILAAAEDQAGAGPQSTDTHGARRPRRFRTPLTHTNLKRGHERRAPSPHPFPHVCRKCGAELGNLDRIYCPKCFPEARVESMAKARAEVQRVRDRQRGGQARKASRPKTPVPRRRQDGSRDRRFRVYDPAVFREEIQPGLRHFTGPEMAEATGLSDDYCRLIRNGKFVPDPRHWPALRRLAAAAPVVPEMSPDYYRENILPELVNFSVAEIIEATGLSGSYCRRIRRGTQMPAARWWGALERLGRGEPEELPGCQIGR